MSEQSHAVHPNKRFKIPVNTPMFLKRYKHVRLNLGSMCTEHFEYLHVMLLCTENILGFNFYDKKQPLFVYGEACVLVLHKAVQNSNFSNYAHKQYLYIS